MIQAGNQIFAGIFGALYLFLLVLTGFRSIRYWPRLMGLLIFVYLSGVTALAAGFPASNSLYWFVAFVGLAAIFLHPRFGLLALLAGAATLAALVWLPGAIRGVEVELAEVVDLVATYLVVSLIISVPLAALLQGLERHITKLATDRHELLAQISAAQTTGQDLERRLLQLRTISEISHAANSLLDPAELINQFINLIKERFNLYYVGLFLIDEFGEYAVLHAGTGEAGERMLAEQHQLAVGGTSMIGWTTAHAKARIALDSGAEAIRFNNPHLPETRSELALPLITGQKMIGALTIQSDKPNAFDQNDLAVLQGLVDSLATSLHNANLFQELQNSMHEIEALNRQYLVNAWTQQVAEIVRMEHAYEPPRGVAGGARGELFSAPLVVRGEMIGDLTLESGDDQWTLEEKQLIESVAAQAAQALENARLIQETQYQAYQEQLVSEFGNRIRESFNLDSILRTAVRELGDRLNLAEVQVIAGWDDEHQAE